MDTQNSDIERFVHRCFADQDAGRDLSPDDHRQLLRLVDLKIVGMDRFRYCWPEEARENLARVRR